MKRVAIVGGGVAGLSAAEALARAGFKVTLYEAKRRLGGRAGSFFDEPSGRWLDLCQHIGMGCCSEWLAFCERCRVSSHLCRDRVLHFLGDGGKRYRFEATGWLPPPLHLAPALRNMGFLSWRERMHLVSTLRRLQSLAVEDSAESPSIGEWLSAQGASEQAVRRFYEPVLVSALGESLDRASLAMSRKVFVDGFLTTRDGFHLITPTCPLTEFYDKHVARHLEALGVEVHRSTIIDKVIGSEAGIEGVSVGGALQPFDAVVVCVPWHRLAAILDARLVERVPKLDQLVGIESAPISGIHLWFDRPLFDLRHAAILDRLSQWVFAPPGMTGEPRADGVGYYLQVIVSASQALRSRAESDVLAEVVEDLAEVIPGASEARLVRGRVVTEQQAVFSVRPGLSRQRPAQRTDVPGLTIAGDWTDTGWPATMESAVRSGVSAAEAITQSESKSLG